MLHTQQYYFEFELESFVFRLFLPNYWLVGVGTSPGPSQNRPTVVLTGTVRCMYSYCMNTPAAENLQEQQPWR